MNDKITSQYSYIKTESKRAQWIIIIITTTTVIIINISNGYPVTF